MNGGFSFPNAEAVLATSLTVRREPAVQQQAVGSWLKAGFAVCSVNSPEEISLLQPLFPQVSFVPARRTGQEHFGRPLIYIDDLLAVLKETRAPIVGLINSDIHLDLTAGHRARLPQLTRNAVLCISRMGVETLEEKTGDLFVGGMDAFLFSRERIGQIPPSIFCLGSPWWDYYFPIVCILNEIPLVRFQETVAYHQKHPLNWDRTMWYRMGRYFYERLLDLCAHKKGYNQFRHLSGVFGNAWKCYHVAVHQHPVPLEIAQRVMAYSEFIFGILCGWMRILDPVEPAAEAALSGGLLNRNSERSFQQEASVL